MKSERRDEMAWEPEKRVKDRPKYRYSEFLEYPLNTASDLARKKKLYECTL